MLLWHFLFLYEWNYHSYLSSNSSKNYHLLNIYFGLHMFLSYSFFITLRDRCYYPPFIESKLGQRVICILPKITQYNSKPSLGNSKLEHATTTLNCCHTWSVVSNVKLVTMPQPPPNSSPGSLRSFLPNIFLAPCPHTKHLQPYIWVLCVHVCVLSQLTVSS